MLLLLLLFYLLMEVKGQRSQSQRGPGCAPRGPSSHHDVAAAVQGQVVGPGEGAVALGAAEGFDPRVLAEVSGQLVGAGEAPGAALPGTVVRLLTCGRPGRALAGGRLGSGRGRSYFLCSLDYNSADSSPRMR